MKEHSEPSKEEAKLQSEQKTAEIFFDKVDVSNMLSMVCDQFNASSQGREDFIKKVINDYTTHRIHASQFKSQLPIEQKNELELIIAEKNIDIIHLRDRIKELESQPLPIEQKAEEPFYQTLVGGKIEPSPIEGVEQELSEKEFCSMYTEYHGEEIDKIQQLVSASFTGEELMEFVQHCLATRKGSKSGK